MNEWDSRQLASIEDFRASVPDSHDIDVVLFREKRTDNRTPPRYRESAAPGRGAQKWSPEVQLW